jgi:hypothetical protein
MIMYTYRGHFAIVGLFSGTRKEGEEKRMTVNNIEIHCICAGRGHEEIH